MGAGAVAGVGGQGGEGGGCVDADGEWGVSVWVFEVSAQRGGEGRGGGEAGGAGEVEGGDAGVVGGGGALSEEVLRARGWVGGGTVRGDGGLL